ncbi:carboxypeptidase regulatory-like domain-containing protein [Natronomonas sp.]|uniref:carboxypeptidase regulatory-like domain-containing protein n=1 Tax=Natronomonas sp. TaxID=2184060 RepID=UPI003989E117
MVCWLLVAPVGAVAQSDSQVTLTVSVVDQEDVSVGNAEVTATWDGGETTQTTASNGRVFIDVPEGSDVNLTVEHPDFIRNEPLLVEDASEQDVTLRVSLKGQSTVTVTDTNGDPLADTSVEFSQGGSTVAEGKTDENGEFSTGIIEQGRYRVSTVKPGYFRNSSRVRVGVDTTKQFTLERGSVRLDVEVYDDHFEEPKKLDNAQIRINDAEGEVASVRASGGSASISVGVNTLYSATVTKEGYVETKDNFYVRESDRSINLTTQRVPTLVVEPQNSRVVIGENTRVQVVNAYEEPVEGAEIRYEGETVGETDANGELSVTIDTAGPQEFRAVKDGVESENVTIEGIDPDAKDTEEPSTQTPTDTSAVGAGPGVGIAAAALAAALLLRRRR